MDAGLHNFYNWFFIIVILAAAAWLVMAVLNQSAPLTAAFTSSATGKVCPACGAHCDPAAKFCKSCGRDLTAA
jgi:uncharacterized OB-fold protein